MKYFKVFEEFNTLDEIERSDKITPEQKILFGWIDAIDNFFKVLTELIKEEQISGMEDTDSEEGLANVLWSHNNDFLPSDRLKDKPKYRGRCILPYMWRMGTAIDVLK